MGKLILFVAVLLPALANAHEESCKIKDQSGSSEFMWCQKHGFQGTIRCYADVEYEDGHRHRFWGRECYSGFADCWWSGAGGVEPDCAE